MIQFDKVQKEARAEVEKFVVRLPGGMRQAIADVARRSRRSMNSEIVARLEHSLADQDAIEPTAEDRFQSPALRAVTNNALQATASDQERRLLQAFRQLDAGKQQALLKLMD
jgi:hypothetical protein